MLLPRQEQVITIKGEPAEVLDLQRLLDLKVVAAGGFVSPEAEEVIGRILEANPGNIAARYYLGALYNQTDRPDLALQLWRQIIENGDPNDFHVASARAQVGDAAFRAGVEYALPEARGPSLEQMDAAQDMSEEDRQAMIGGMVAGLAERLANRRWPRRRLGPPDPRLRSDGQPRGRKHRLGRGTAGLCQQHARHGDFDQCRPRCWRLGRMICDTPEEFVTAIPKMGAIAGLDLGTVTIGVAVSDVHALGRDPA